MLGLVYSVLAAAPAGAQGFDAGAPAEVGCSPASGDAQLLAEDVAAATAVSVDQSDGIPSAEVNGLAEDIDGFVWMSTPRGLARWDGRDMEVVDADPTTEPTLSGFLVADVEPAAEGGVWVAARTLQHVDLDQGTIQDSGVRADDIAVAGTRVWALAPPEIRLYDASSGRVVVEVALPDYTTLTGPTPLAALDDRALIGTSTGLIVVDDTGSIDVLELEGGVGAVTPRARGGAWVASSSGIVRYDAPDRLELVHEFTGDPGDSEDSGDPDSGNADEPLQFRTGIVERADGTVWIAMMPSGVAIYDPASGTFARASRVGDYETLPAAMSIIEDRLGGLWLTDHLTAVVRASSVRTGFGAIGLPEDETIPSGTLFGQAWFAGHHWAAVGGPTGGLIKLDERGAIVETYRSDGTDSPATLPVNQTIDLLPVGDELWIGHSWIRVSASRLSQGTVSDRIQFAVSDPGPGMTEEEAAEVMSERVRGADASGSGFGLGLTIASTLLRRYGSKLEVDTRPGGPTTFSFVLDLLRADVVPQELPKAMILVRGPVMEDELIDLATLNGWQATAALCVADVLDRTQDGAAGLLLIEEGAAAPVRRSELRVRFDEVVDVGASLMMDTEAGPVLAVALATELFRDRLVALVEVGEVGVDLSQRDPAA